jgi:hypothetical protein
MTNYSTKLSDNQYSAIKQIIGDVRRRTHPLREVLNAVFYL